MEGMREQELREKGTCDVCGKGIGHSGAIQFFRVKIDTHMIDFGALRRNAGLAMQIGPALAGVMGPDEEMTKLAHSSEFSLCQECALAGGLTFAELWAKTTEGEEGG